MCFCFRFPSSFSNTLWLIPMFSPTFSTLKSGPYRVAQWLADSPCGMWKGRYDGKMVYGITCHSRCSMYGIFTYIYHKFKPNVGKYSIHGSNGMEFLVIWAKMKWNNCLIFFNSLTSSWFGEIFLQMIRAICDWQITRAVHHDKNVSWVG